MTEDAKAALLGFGFMALMATGIVAGCLHANEMEERRIAAQCEVYKENPTWLSTTELKVWHKLNCKGKEVEREAHNGPRSN